MGYLYVMLYVERVKQLRKDQGAVLFSILRFLGVKVPACGMIEKRLYIEL